MKTGTRRNLEELAACAAAVALMVPYGELAIGILGFPDGKATTFAIGAAAFLTAFGVDALAGKAWRAAMKPETAPRACRGGGSG